MEINSFFQIGKEHKVCEDYALHGLLPFPYVILSDGCSSNEFTDIGSRILSVITQKNLSQFNPEKKELFLEEIIVQANEAINLLGINKDALNGTLILIFNFNNKIYSMLVGDGCLIYSNKKNETISIIHEYEMNYPYYLNYFGKNISNEKKLIIKENDTNKSYEYDFIKLYEFEESEINWIVASTDGIFSFSNGSELYDFENIKNSIADFKSFKGDFIERKMKRIIKNLNKEGFYNSDDWSLGGIFLGE